MFDGDKTAIEREDRKYACSYQELRQVAERHKYEYRVQPDMDHVGNKITAMVGKDKRVLEIGAGPGSITRLLVEGAGCDVTALEYDREALEKLSLITEKAYFGDLNRGDWYKGLPEGEEYDVVVAADVLEHLPDPWSVLRDIRGLIKESGYAVISLPHVSHKAVIAAMAAGEFPYGVWGLLDRTHLRFFGLRDMVSLFRDTGWVVRQVDFVIKSPEQTEFAKYWRRAPKALRVALDQTAFGNVYQVVVKLEKATTNKIGIDLEAANLPAPGPTIPKRAPLKRKLVIAVKMIGRRMLSQKTLSKISSFLTRYGIRI